jgi:AraC family transcriptional regulator, L-rhamnose operon transcriptional activator RhaR
MKLNYRSEISLSDLALHSLLSKNYFSRLFKEVTGTNVSDYIQYLRTEQACTLLRTTDMKIVEIATQVLATADPWNKEETENFLSSSLSYELKSCN